MSWLPNSDYGVQLMVGRWIDAMNRFGAVNICFYPEKKKVTVMIRQDKVEDFEKWNGFIKTAVTKKTVGRNNRIVWYTFYLPRLLSELQQRGFKG